MVIYMQHPVHGNKVAVLEEEAVADEKNGWKRVSMASATVTVTQPPPAVTTLDDISGPELSAMYEQKFGKKPHHKKSEATLRAELAAMGPFTDRA